MKNAIVLDAEDIKKILAEKYKVDEKNVIKSQYSYTVIVDSEHNQMRPFSGSYINASCY